MSRLLLWWRCLARPWLDVGRYDNVQETAQEFIDAMRAEFGTRDALWFEEWK